MPDDDRHVTESVVESDDDWGPWKAESKKDEPEPSSERGAKRKMDEFNLVMGQKAPKLTTKLEPRRSPEPSAAKHMMSSSSDEPAQEPVVCAWCSVSLNAAMALCLKCEATVCLPCFKDFACKCDISVLAAAEVLEEPPTARQIPPPGPPPPPRPARQPPPPPPPPQRDPELSVWANFAAQRAAQGRWVPRRPPLPCDRGDVLCQLGWSAPPAPRVERESVSETLHKLGWNMPP